MFKKILAAVDGSDYSHGALAVATDLARESGADLVIAHVDEKFVGKGGAGSLNVDEPEIKAGLVAKAAELTTEGIDTETKVASIVLGGPAPAIAKIASDAGADLIVVATRGHSAIAEVLVGSVTQRLLQLANCPVMAVPTDRMPKAETHERETAAVAG